MSWLFLAVLAVWMLCSVLRFIHMYDSSSIFQRWRRWDIFHLVPVGAFFGPRPPEIESWIVVRDFFPDGRFTPWTEVPRIRARAWSHAFFNPQKHIYKAKSELSNSLIKLLSGLPPQTAPGLPPTIFFSDEYLAVLRFATALPRVTKPSATQFGVIATHIVNKQTIFAMVSLVHQMPS